MTEIIYDNIIYKLQKFGGISTYWFELTKRLLNDQNFNSSFIEYKNENVFNRSLEIREGLIKMGRLPLFLERFNNPKLNNYNQSFIFHSSYNRFSTNINAKNITTVHDLIHHKFYGGIRSLLHNYQKENALSHSKAIITVSKNTKKDLLEVYPWLDPDLVHVIYNGVSSDYFIIDQEDYKYENTQEILDQKYIVCVSSREPYKNFPLVIEVLHKLSDYKLYVVGPTLKEYEVQNLNNKIPNRWKAFTSISNKSLNEIYNHSAGMIYPSSYEGFGITILEAMKAGCPTVTLNTSSIPEVAGNGCVMIDEPDVTEFLKGFDTAINDRHTIIKKGLVQADKFSWDKCYQQTSALYRSLNE